MIPVISRHASNPSSDQALADDPPQARSAPVGVLIVATVGWFLAVVAVLVLHWPLDGAQPTIAVRHLLRLMGTVPGETAAAATVRRFLDAAIYVILLLGTGFLLAVWIRRPQGALRGSAVAAFLGIVYTAGMALYTGPMIGVCGFTLTLCSTLISLAALSALGAKPTAAPLISDIIDHNNSGNLIDHSVLIPSPQAKGLEVPLPRERDLG